MKFKPYDYGVDVIDFIKIMLIETPHKDDEILYLVLAIVDLFRDISEIL